MVKSVICIVSILGSKHGSMKKKKNKHATGVLVPYAVHSLNLVLQL